MDTHQTNLSHEFSLARRSTYLKINLDTILNNIRILKQKCAAHTGKGLKRTARREMSPPNCWCYCDQFQSIWLGILQ